MANSYTVLSREAIVYICGLIHNIASTPYELISDTTLATNQTMSSVKIDKLIDQCLKDANDKAVELVNTLTHLTCEKTTVQPTLDNSEKNIIYLYSADGNAPFQQYLKINDTELIDMGNTSISLNDYLTAIEIANTYAKKIDLDTLTNKVTDIDTTIGDSTQLEDNISNEIVALKGKSALKTLTQAQYTELITNGSVVVDGETITFSNDDYYVISDDSENINLDSFNLKTYTLPSQLGLTNDCTIDNIIQVLPVKSSYLGDSATITNKSQFPTATSDYTFIINKSTTSRYSVIATDKETGKMYTGKVSANSPFTFNGWTKVCTTSVEDVLLNNVTDTLVPENATGGTLSYYVKDGICYIELDAITISSISSGGSLSSFYFPVPYLNRRSGYKTIQSWKGNNVLQLSVMSNGKLAYWCENSSVGSIFYGQFSYPIADS